MRKIPSRLLACAMIFIGKPLAAQTVISMSTLSTGRNIYSPTVIYDAQAHIYKMWYGGWQTNADYPHDKIYYRTSTDGLAWTGPTTVLTPTQVGPSAVHVNDPSVTKIYNAVDNRYQYTMFYTVCVNTCTNNTDNQIWSSISTDGINWVIHAPLIESNGASTPSSIVSKKSNGSVWTVYYSNTSENGNLPTHVFSADVDGNRKIINHDAVVYTYNADDGILANPEVRQIGNDWDLFFNVYHTVPGASHATADIYVSTANTNRYWESTSAHSMIANNPSGSVCLTLSPGVIPVNKTGKFLMYFGQGQYVSGSRSCNFSDISSIQEWTWQK